jgi:hypothetical protein
MSGRQNNAHPHLNLRPVKNPVVREIFNASAFRIAIILVEGRFAARTEVRVFPFENCSAEFIG